MSRASTIVRPALGAVLVAGLAAASATLGRTATTEARRLWSGRTDLAFDDLVLACSVSLLAAVAGWLGVAILLTLAAEGPDCVRTFVGRLARLVTPSLCRAVLGGACGAAVLAGPSALLPASAVALDPRDARSPTWPAGRCLGGPADLPLPDRPLSSAPTVQEHSLRVRRGDTLWAIAARRLPDGATNAEIARAWPRWFRANRDRVGPDPHLIRSGTRLRVPARLTDEDRPR